MHPIEPSNEHYNSEFYQRTVEIQRLCQNGMSAKDLYAREADWALQSANIDFKPGDKILDLACGAGYHVERIHEKTGATVEGMDLSPTLIARANSRIHKEQDQTRGEVTFALGDMTNVKNHIKTGKKYRLVTIMGSSFIYYRSRKRALEAFRDYCDLLEPGGKIVLQFRDWNGKPQNPEVMDSIWQILGVKTEKVAAGTTDKLPMNNTVQRDLERKDGFYVYLADAEPPPDEPSELIRKAGEPKVFKDQHGVEHSAFGRSYIDASGVEHDLGVTQSMDWMSEEPARNVLKPTLEEAGFANVQLKMDPEPLSPDKTVRNWAIVGEKVA